MRTVTQGALAALAFFAVVLDARPSDAGIVIKTDGKVFIGTIGAESFKDAKGEVCAAKDYETLTMKSPKKFKGQEPLRGEIVFKKSEVRWYDATAEEPTEEYMKRHADEKLDAAWYADYVEPWKAANRSCADCGAKAAGADANFCAKCGKRLEAVKGPGEKKNPAGAAEENFWKGVGIGTSVEYSMVSNFGTEMKMTMKMILAAKDERTYQLDTEVMGNKSSGSPIPWTGEPAKPDPNGPKVENLDDEELTAGGVKYKCKHTRTTDDNNKVVTEVWTYKGLLIKASTKMNGAAKGTSDMLLEKLEKK